MSINSPIPPEENQDLNISESSVKDSQVGIAGRDLTQIRANAIEIIKKPTNIAIATLTAIVGAVGIIFAGDYRFKSDNINTKNIKVDGDINAPATFGDYSPLTIYEGDPPEVRQKKLEQAQRLIAEEVLTNINNMDARLSYVAAALEDDNFDQRLQDVRNQVAPSLSENFDSGYRQLIRQQETSSLRNAFNSRPLYEVREPLIQVLIDGEADPEKAKVFSNSLTEVKDVSESLFNELSAAAKLVSAEPDQIEHHKKRIELAVERLINRSQIAHLSGLMVLNSLEISLPNVETNLSNLQHIEPQHLISINEANILLIKQVKQAQILLWKRAAIVEEAQTFRDQALTEYKNLNKQLIIKNSDPWNIVVAKAVSLRQLGRTSEAVAGFSRYSDMFADTDPTAKQYARTAQQFTIQLNNLGVEGGVYIYEVVEGGVADQAGLKVGDIIISYGDNKIANMNDMTKALQKNLTNHQVRLTYLRLSSAGTFERQTITVVKAGSLGAGLMPI